jgi:hypothetical protein
MFDSIYFLDCKMSVKLSLKWGMIQEHEQHLTPWVFKLWLTTLQWSSQPTPGRGVISQELIKTKLHRCIWQIGQI